MTRNFKLCHLIFILGLCQGFPDPGRFEFHVNSSQEFNGVVKNVYNGTKIFVKVKCTPEDVQTEEFNRDQIQLKIGWVLRETICWNEYAFMENLGDLYKTYYEKPELILDLTGYSNRTNYVKYPETDYKCNPQFQLNNLDAKAVEINQDANQDYSKLGKPQAQYTVTHDGNYLFVIHIGANANFDAIVEVDMQGPQGYLSVVDWPLLPFYGLMCGLYVAMGLGWLIVCSMHWRDLLRIQFWIGAVIFLGMLEKALFYAEFQNINSTGYPTKNLIIMAEVVSCAKRTLARYVK